MKTNLILVLRILIAIAPLKKENVYKYVFFLMLMESLIDVFYASYSKGNAWGKVPRGLTKHVLESG